MVVHRCFSRSKIEEVVEPAETILGDMGMILRDLRVSFAFARDHANVTIRRERRATTENGCKAEKVSKIRLFGA